MRRKGADAGTVLLGDTMNNRITVIHMLDGALPVWMSIIPPAPFVLAFFT